MKQATTPKLETSSAIELPAAHFGVCGRFRFGFFLPSSGSSLFPFYLVSRTFQTLNLPLPPTLTAPL